MWAAAADIWLRSPIFGIGFRQHERFMPDHGPAHNSYLAMLADTGIVGLTVYLVLLIGSLVAALRMEDQRTRRFVVGIIVAYIVSGFFDRRTIDPANPYSVFFVMCCSLALVERSLRKVAQIRREPFGIASRSPLTPGSAPP
jgi:O-antigen ligase